MTNELRPRIIVLGVGGAGGNAVDNMIDANLQGVEFVVANTDAQALERSKSAQRIQLGPETTSGLGAGARPDVGAAAADESLEEVICVIGGANMVFIAAGMGGGTGTGAAPIIAKAARESGVLTVGVVTKPFGFEGARRMALAEEGLEEMRKHVDTLIVVPNQNLFRIANERTTFAEAFRLADDVLYSGVRGITDLMVMPGLINLDFADVRSIMKDMGSAMMGMAEAEGETRALEAAKHAIDNPLLDGVSMKGARGVLINITGGYDMTLFEVDEAANEVRAEVDGDANIILGSTFDPEMEGRIRVSVVAAGVDGAYSRTAMPAAGAAAAAFKADAQAKAAETPVEPPAERPVVVTHHAAEPDTPPPASAEREAGPAEPPAPPGGYLSTPGEIFEDGDVPTGNVFGGLSKPQDGDAPDSPPEGQGEGGAGFANLFGWRRGQQDESEEGAERSEEAIVSTPDDHPEPAPFDDSDLEIPAFLRRSANH